jgi:hypothetical protein
MAAAKPHVPISAVGTAVAGGVVTGAPELAAELPASCVAVPASPPPPHALSAAIKLNVTITRAHGVAQTAIALDPMSIS